MKCVQQFDKSIKGFPGFFFFREYVDKNVVQFARQNPQVTIYVRERNGQHPRIVANYCKYYQQFCLAKEVDLILNNTLLNSFYTRCN